MLSSQLEHNHRANLSTIVVVLYSLTLALLPWTWFPPFPWLHEHAQWSDALFAATAVAWAIERWQTARPFRFRPIHALLGLYFVFAALSLLFAAPNPRAGLLKLLGIAELCGLALVTHDLMSRPGASRNVGRAIAITSLVTALAAVIGLILFYAGVRTHLIGIYGELEPSNWYARVQAGTYNPNLLASFCIFAAAVVSRRDAEVPVALRRLALVALWVTVLLTFSRGILGFIVAASVRNAVTPRKRRLAALASTLCVALMIGATIWKPTIDPSNPFGARIEPVHSSRLQAAITSLKTLAGRPLFGSGLGTHPGEYRGAPFDAHFTPLNIAATIGIPALIVFLALIAVVWRRRRRPVDLSIWGGLAGLAVDGLGQDIEDFRHLWVMIGLAEPTSSREGESSEAGMPVQPRAGTPRESD